MLLDYQKDFVFRNTMIDLYIQIVKLRNIDVSLKDLFSYIGPINTKIKWYNIFELFLTLGENFFKDKEYMSKTYDIWKQMSLLKQKSILQEVKTTVKAYLSINSINMAPNDAPLNKYAFADQRVGKVPQETNNKLEQELYKSLYFFFTTNTFLSSEQVNLLQSILKNGYYKDVIHEPIENIVYRGMLVNDLYIQNALNVSTIPTNGKIDTMFTFKPKYNCSSWTTNIGIAREFAESKQMFSLILIAKISNNPYKFVSGPDGLYNVDDKLATHKREDEVIGLGEIKVSSIEWNLNK